MGKDKDGKWNFTAKNAKNTGNAKKPMLMITDTEKEFFKEEQRSELYRAMKRLNPDYYQVLYLMYFEDLNASDIARIMHKAKRQVNDLIFRARKSLKNELERRGFVYERY